MTGYNIWGAVVTEVEMDVLTGERNILRCDLIEDTGATINPEVDIGKNKQNCACLKDIEPIQTHTNFQCNNILIFWFPEIR